MKKSKLAVIFSIIFILFAVLGIAKFSKNSEAADPTLVIEGGPQEIVVGDASVFIAYYDPDGDGPEPRQDISNDAHWRSSAPGVARSLGAGWFRGRSPGDISVSVTTDDQTLSAPPVNLRVVEPPPQFLCSSAASPVVKIETNGYGTYQVGGNMARNDSRTEEISVPVGTRLNFTSSESAEPLSRVEITYPNGFTRYFNEPDWNGRSFTTDPLNAGSEIRTYAVQRCSETDCAYSDGQRCERRAPPRSGEEECSCRRVGERWTTTLSLVNNPPPQQEFGTVAVSSNIPTTWDITKAGVRQTELSRSSPSAGISEGRRFIGSYTITNIPLEVRNYNGKDWENPRITPSQTQTLTDGDTITFSITYTEKPGTPPSGCDISVTSNLPTSWGMDGPEDRYDRNGQGTYALYEDLGAGRYRMSAEDISGYNKEITPTSMNCAEGGSIDFVINYQRTGGGETRKKCVDGNRCAVVNEVGSDQCAQDSDCNRPALDCSPATHPAVDINESARFSASGGTAPYSWNAPGGSPRTGRGASFSTDYDASGNKTITLTDSASDTSTCHVRVCPAGGCGANEFPSGMHQYADLDGTDGRASDNDAPGKHVTVNIYDGTELVGSTVTTGANNTWSVSLPVSVRDGNAHWIHARAVDYLPGGGSGLEVALSNTPLKVQNVGGTHFECVSNSCVERPGGGGNGCNPSISTCTGNHYSCSGASCAMDYNGSYTSANCDNACGGGGTHLECGAGGKCKKVSGGGPNIDNCNDVTQSCVAGKHLECKFTFCSLVDGTGPNLDGCGNKGSGCSGGIDYGCNAIGFCEAKRGGAGNCQPANEEWDCPQPPPECTLVANKPKLVIPPPGTVTVSWNCRYAKTCTLNGVSVSPDNGSKDYSPNQTTYYTLRCTGKGNTVGEWTQEVGVKVYRFIEGILREVRPN